MVVNQQKALEQTKALVLSQLSNVDVRVYLFGSRAHNKAGRYSDIDIALLPKTVLPFSVISLIKEALEESSVPYFVDVVDLSKTDDLFRNKKETLIANTTASSMIIDLVKSFILTNENTNIQIRARPKFLTNKVSLEIGSTRRVNDTNEATTTLAS